MKEIITPALVLDLELLKQNIKLMADFGRKNHIGIRPHFKTHKCLEIARLQIKAGAVGITAQTIDETEALVKGGIKSVLLANQLVEQAKIERFLSLCDLAPEVLLCVDSENNLRLLDKLAGAAGVKLKVLVEVDIGMNRSGRKPGEDTVHFVKKVLACPNIEFKGLQGYEGHAVLISDREERIKTASAAVELLAGARKLLLNENIKCQIVSAGGTGTYDLTGKNSGVTDIQPGSYVFMDAKYAAIRKEFIPALCVHTTVLASRGKGVYTADAGHKALTSEFGMPALLDKTGSIEKLNEEHTRLKLTQGSLLPGDRVRILPSHCCTTVNLYDNVYVSDKSQVSEIWKIQRQRAV